MEGQISLEGTPLIDHGYKYSISLLNALLLILPLSLLAFDAACSNSSFKLSALLLQLLLCRFLTPWPTIPTLLIFCFSCCFYVTRLSTCIGEVGYVYGSRSHNFIIFFM